MLYLYGYTLYKFMQFNRLGVFDNGSEIHVQ